MSFSPQVLGVTAVLVFAMTIPMTRLANGTLDDPQLPPLFVALGRAALAGALAGAYLLLRRAAWPTRTQWPWLMAVVLGGVLAFPIGMGWAVRVVPAAHAAVIVGALPLCTAALAAWWLGQRPGPWFWAAAGMGCTLVLVYAGWAVHRPGPVSSGALVAADAWLVLALCGASVAYVAGAVLSRQMDASQVISWALVLALPLTVPAACLAWPGGEPGSVRWSSWAALAYVAVGSTWLGFFAWYAALARDPMGVSQLQLMQPFLSIGLSCLLLGEPVDAITLLFAGAVLLVVMMAQYRPTTMGAAA